MYENNVLNRVVSVCLVKLKQDVTQTIIVIYTNLKLSVESKCNCLSFALLCSVIGSENVRNLLN